MNKRRVKTFLSPETICDRSSQWRGVKQASAPQFDTSSGLASNAAGIGCSNATATVNATATATATSV